MATNETVRTIRIQGRSDGLPEIEARLKSLGAEQRALIGTSDALATASESSARRQLSASNAMERLLGRIDPASRSLQQLTRDLNILGRASDTGYFKGLEGGAERFSKVLDRLKAQYREVSGLQAEIDRRDPATHVAATAQAQSRINTNVGVADRLGRYTAGSAEESARAFLDADADAVRRLRTEYNQYAVALQRKDEAQARSNVLLARGAIGAEEHTIVSANIEKVYQDTKRALDGSNTSLGKYSSGMGLARHEMINFSRQAQDVFVSLAAGQPIMTVLIQQGTQIADIFSTSKGSIGGFFGQLAVGAAKFATSIAGAATGAIALGAAAAYASSEYSSGQRDIERGLNGVGRASGATVNGINEIAEASARAAKISVASAREIALEFARTGKIAPDLYASLTGVAKNYGAQTGQTTPEAAAELAKAFTDPLRGADALNEKLGFLDSRTRNYIRTLVEQNDRAGAQRVLLEAVGQATAGAADNTSRLAKAWQAVSAAASDAWDNLGKAGQAASPEKRLEDAQRILSAQRQSREKFGVWGGVTEGDLKGTEGVVASLGEDVRRRGALSSGRSATATASAQSLRSAGVIEGLDAAGTELRKLRADLKEIQTTLDNPLGRIMIGDLDKAREGADKLKNAIETTLSPMERLTRTGQVNIASINARSVAERAAVDVAREAINLSGQKITGLEREISLNQKAIEVQAQANREARDFARTAADNLSLAGLKPYERARKQAEIDARNRQETIGNGGGTGSTMDMLRQFEGFRTKPYWDVNANRAGYGSDTVTRANGSVEKVTKDTIVTMEEAERDLARRVAQFQDTIRQQIGAERFNGMAENVKASLTSIAYNYGNLPKDVAGAARSGDPAAIAEAIRARGGDNNGVNRARRNAEAENIEGNRSSLAAGMRDTMKAIDIEQIEGPLKAANQALNEQIALNQRAAQTWFMSTAEVTKAAESQRLMNEYSRAGIPITADLAAGIDAYAKRAGQAAEEVKRVGDVQKALVEASGLMKDFTKGMYSDIRNGASGLEALQNQLNRLADKLFDMAMNDLFAKAFGGGGGNGFFSSLLGSLFGAGGGGGSNPLDFSRGAGGSYGPGFSEGGFTGAGGKHQPAGTVHRGEYVFDAQSTSRIGVSTLEAMRRGLPGYAEGGYVGTAANGNSPSSSGNWNVNVINNARGAEVETKQNSDGSLDVFVDMAEGNIARKMIRRRGALYTAQANAGNLRG